MRAIAARKFIWTWPIREKELQVMHVTSAHQLGSVRWRKSSFSNASGNCVEIGELPGGAIAIRNSRGAAGPALIYTRAELAAFLAGVRNGEFDDLG
jgi:hypothetical protein